MGYQIQKNIFWVHIRVLWSSFPLHWKPNILLVNYDSWWQHQMSVRELRHDRPSGWFSKSRGLSASVSFLSSPPPPRSFTYAIFRAVFDSRSSFFSPKPHGNACYAGYLSRCLLRLALHDIIFSMRSAVFLDERAIIVQLRWVLWNQRARSRSTRYLQISRWQFGADSSIILEFIALRVKARGDGPFVL